jgi:hypothetical protein
MFGNIPFPTLDQMDLDVAEKKNVANPFLPSRVAPPNYKIFADLAKLSATNRSMFSNPP